MKIAKHGPRCLGLTTIISVDCCDSFLVHNGEIVCTVDADDPLCCFELMQQVAAFLHRNEDGSAGWMHVDLTDEERENGRNFDDILQELLNKEE